MWNNDFICYITPEHYWSLVVWYKGEIIVRHKFYYFEKALNSGNFNYNGITVPKETIRECLLKAVNDELDFINLRRDEALKRKEMLNESK